MSVAVLYTPRLTLREYAPSIRVVEKLEMSFEKQVIWRGQEALLYAVHAPMRGLQRDAGV